MNGLDAKLPNSTTQSHTEGEIRMETKETGLIGFDPVKFIELLLKLDSRAKGHEVSVEVTKRKKKEAQTA
jgi:hypothetical protein